MKRPVLLSVPVLTVSVLLQSVLSVPSSVLVSVQHEYNLERKTHSIGKLQYILKCGHPASILFETRIDNFYNKTQKQGRKIRVGQWTAKYDP